MSHNSSLRIATALALAVLPFAAHAEGDDFDVTDAPPPATSGPPSHPAIAILPLVPIQQPGPDYHNEVVFGGGWQSNVGMRASRYTGINGPGGFAIGGFRSHGGDAWDSGKSFYYDLEFSDVGLDTRALSIRAGERGSWGVGFYYNGMIDNYSNSFRSVWDLNRNLVPGVAPGSVKNAQTLTPLLRVEDIYSRRQVLGADAKVQFGDWLVQTNLRHEHRDGYKENSLAILGAPSPIANNGNITSSALAYFAEPINYDTDRYDISAQYSQGPLQLLFGYTFNNFTDNNASANLANPFQFTGTASVTGASAGAVAGSSRITSIYSLPPSNSAHQVKAQVGYNLTPTTRINANFQYGMMLQNSPFVAGTGNANLVAAAPPATSLDGAIQTFNGNIAATTQPFANADLRVSYKIDDRRNQTDRRKFSGQYYQDAFSASPIAPITLPLSYEHQVFEAQGGYRILPQTKLTVGYAYESTQRNYANTGMVTQGTISAKVRSQLVDSVFGSVGYSHEDRSASNYQRNNPWTALGMVENEFYGFMNYYEASRVRDEVKSTVDWEVRPNLTATFMGRADMDRYPNSLLGLRNNNNFSIGPDLSWQINPSLVAHGYYTFQLIRFDQSSAVSNASCNGNGMTLATGPAPCLNNGSWTGRNIDTTHSAGISLDWQAREDLKLSADYTFSYGRNAYSLADGGIYSFTPAGTASLQLAPLPDVTSMLNSISLRAEYQIRQNISVWAGYTFERFNYKDYATQVGANQFSNALFTGDSNGSYAIHRVMAALRIKW